MAKNVIMPQMGITTTEGTVIRWLKGEGDPVTQGEPLVEITTDKVNMEIEAPESGILSSIVAPQGAVVPIAETLCIIAQPGEAVGAPQFAAVGAATAAASAGRETYVRASPIAKRLARENLIDLAAIAPTGPEGRVVEADVLKFIQMRAAAPALAVTEAVKATPVARVMARNMGVDLSEVAGSGSGGRVTRTDVIGAAEKVVAAASARSAAPAVPAAAQPGITSTVPVTGLRRTIAQRMSQSSQTVARVTHTTEVDVTETVRMREQLVEESERLHGVRISYTDIVVKMVARALRLHPMMNSRLVDDEIQVLDQVNVGVAVSVPQGLIVPVIHDADRKDLVVISRETREKVDRARAGTVTYDDISGGTFTVTNLGSYEIDAFTPIVNLPEVGILGVGRIVEKPAIFEGEIAKRSMMFLSLSFDHRVIDGAPAAEFLRDLKHLLEKPYTMLI